MPRPHGRVDAIAVRRALRAFSDRPVEKERVAALIEAMRLVPGCSNNPPWRAAVRRQKGFANRRGVERGNAWMEAPLMLAVASEPSLDRRLNEGALSSARLRPCRWPDAAAGHRVGGDRPCHRRIRSLQGQGICGVPDEHSIMAVISCGYPGEDASPPSEKRSAQQGERLERLPRGEAFSNDGWGEPYVDVERAPDRPSTVASVPTCAEHGR